MATTPGYANISVTSDKSFLAANFGINDTMNFMYPDPAQQVGCTPNSTGLALSGSSQTATYYEGGATSGIRWSMVRMVNQSLTWADPGSSAVGNSVKLWDFPEGLIYLFGGVSKIYVGPVGTGLTSLTSVGVIASGATGLVTAVGTVAAAVDATLTSTEANIIPSATFTISSSVGSATGKTATVGGIIDGTATAASAYLNFAGADADSAAAGTIPISGFVLVKWMPLGDA